MYKAPRAFEMLKDILDKASPVPLYHQLASWLERKIADRTYDVGCRLPSETRLAEDFRLNRNTVRQALSYLVQKGLIERQRGVGTFVKRRATIVPIHHLGRITSFIDDFEITDVRLEDRVLDKGIIEASDEIVIKLGLQPGTSVIKIERLRIADKTPFVVEQQYYNYEDFAGLLELNIQGSMYRILVDRFGADLHHSVQTLQAVNPTPEIAQQLNIPRITPCIFLESIAYTSDDKPLELLHSHYRGDRYLFKVESSHYRRSISSIPE
jgi:GntR family transcriptional regulator